MRTRLGAAFGVVVLLVAVMMTLALGRIGELEQRAAAAPDKPAAGSGCAPERGQHPHLDLGLGGAVLLASVVCWFRLTRAIEIPLKEAEFIAETVAAGDLSKEFETERGGVSAACWAGWARWRTC